MKNLKIGTRMLLSYAIIIFFLVISTIISLVLLNNNAKVLTGFYETNYTNTIQAWNARHAMKAIQVDIYKSAVTTDDQLTNQYINLATEEEKTLNNAISILKTGYTGDQSLINEITAALSDALTLQEQVFALSRAQKIDETLALMDSQYIPALDKISDKLIELTSTVENNAKQKIETGQRQVSVAYVVLCVLAGGCILMAMAIAFFIAKSVTNPLKEIQNAAYELAEGNLKATVTYSSKDELGVLSEALRNTFQKLNEYITDLGRGLQALSEGNLTPSPVTEFKGDFVALEQSLISTFQAMNVTMKKINQAAELVSTGSEQVSSGAQALSQGATEQASSVEELAATIQDISKQVQSNAESAITASNKAADAGQQVEISNQHMWEMQEAMAEIAEKSSQIGKIIKTINDISFQTNILSLNAAVEAARAGAAGKGFAVVASEVKQLAEKSSEAVKDTTALIESTVNAVTKGAQITESTASSLLAVVENVKETSGIIRQISEASKHQALSIEQITQGINQVSAVVQTNSATAEESAAASEELSGQAQTLKEQVRRFQLRDDL